MSFGTNRDDGDDGSGLAVLLVIAGVCLFLFMSVYFGGTP